MPISPDNMKLYPGGSIKSPQWLAIRAYVQARAGGRCEECGVRNLAYGVRMDGEFTDLGTDKTDALIEYEYAIGIATMFAGDGADLSRIPPLIRIVCTTAHMDRGLTDHSAANLKFLCQKCHNTHDAPSRAANARRTIAAKSGQAELL